MKNHLPAHPSDRALIRLIKGLLVTLCLLSGCGSDETGRSVTPNMTPQEADWEISTVGDSFNNSCANSSCSNSADNDASLPPFTNAPPLLNTEGLNWWQPSADTPIIWDWQIGHLTPQPNPGVTVYNIDIDTDPAARATLAKTGAKLICYFSVGTVENWRDDADQFPAAVIGERYEQLPGERWLNYKRIDLLAPIMLARLNRCAAMGFDAVEADNVDAFNYETRNALGEVVRIGTNFNITEEDTVAYVRWLAQAAHSRGLSLGLKNAEAIAESVVDVIDFMVTEECILYDWCEAAQVMVERNKPVLAAEYIDFSETQSLSYVCQQAKRYGFHASHFKTNLNNEYFAACDN